MIHLALMAVALYVLVCVGLVLVPYAVGVLLFGVPLVLALAGLRWLSGPLGEWGALGVFVAGVVCVALALDGAQRYRRRRARALALRYDGVAGR
jgi:hypothetical protein